MAAPPGVLGQPFIMRKSSLNQISPHVYWLSPDPTTDRPVLGAICGERSTLLVDAGNSPAHASLFLNELAKLKIVAPKFLVLTHWHWDHVFGTTRIDLPTIAHVETRRIVMEMTRWDWSDEALDRRVEAGLEIEFCRDMIKAELPNRHDLRLRPPDIAFTHQLELDLGSVTAHIAHVGGDHAPDHSLVYVPEDGIVFVGDCLSEDLYHPPPRYTAANLFPLLDQLLSYKAAFYLAGHNPEPLSKAGLAETASLLKTIGQTVTRLGPNRSAILAHLKETLPVLDDDCIEIADAFLAGLSE